MKLHISTVMMPTDIVCSISLNPGNDFSFNGDSGNVACTHDGVYCARVERDMDTDWKILVTNDGVLSFPTNLRPDCMLQPLSN